MIALSSSAIRGWRAIIHNSYRARSALLDGKQLIHSAPATSDVFRSIVDARRSAQSFNPKRGIADDVMLDIMEMTLKTPTSFNAQPWGCVLVRGDGKPCVTMLKTILVVVKQLTYLPSPIEDQRAALGRAMTGRHNAQRVRDAPVTAVFLADREAVKRLPLMLEKERELGKPSHFFTYYNIVAYYLYG